MKIVSYITTAILVLSFSSYAESYKPCSEMVQECMIQTKNKRNNCFFTSAKHPFCEGTPLGKLIFNRWALGANQPDAVDTHALMGPVIVDKTCLDKFDTEWAAFLIKEDITDETITVLREKLNSCTKDVAEHLSRP